MSLANNQRPPIARDVSPQEVGEDSWRSLPSTLLGNTAAIDPLDSAAHSSIASIKDDRRKYAEYQIAVNERATRRIQTVLDTIGPITRLEINKMAATNPEIYKYIKNLENLHQSLWCKKCGGERVEGAPNPVVDDVNAQHAAALEQLKASAMHALSRVESCSRSIVSCRNEVNTLIAEFNKLATMLEHSELALGHS